MCLLAFQQGCCQFLLVFGVFLHNIPFGAGQNRLFRDIRGVYSNICFISVINYLFFKVILSM